MASQDPGGFELKIAGRNIMGALPKSSSDTEINTGTMEYKVAGHNFGVYLHTVFVPINLNLIWTCDVDWDNDGVYEADEAPLQNALQIRRGREYFINSRGTGFEHFRPGIMTATFLNDDGRFDAFSTDSPLYPNVVEGRYVKVTVKNGSTDTAKTLFAGVIDDINHFERRGVQFTRIRAKDGGDWLRRNKVSVAPSMDVAVAAAVTSAAADAEYPSIWGTDITAGESFIPFWWENARSAAAVLNELNDAELGRLFVAGDGKLTFRGRHNIDTPVTALDQSEMSKDITTPQPWDSVFNIVRVASNPRVVSTGVELWDGSEVIELGAGETHTPFANFFYNSRFVPATNLITPTTDDYVFNQFVDGSGDDFTSDLTVSISATFSESAKLLYTNTGSKTGFITVRKLRGDAWDLPNVTVMEDNQSSTDQPRVLDIDLQHIQSEVIAKGYAAYLVSFTKARRPYPRFTLTNQLAKQFLLDLQSRVSVTIAKKSINDDFRVGYLETNWLTPNGQEVETIVGTETFLDVEDFWVFPTRLGITSIFPF